MSTSLVGRIRTATLLLLLVSVPLAGIIVWSVGAGLDARELQRHADETAQAAERASTAMELRMALYNEWTTVRTAVVMEGFGIGPRMFEAMTGLTLMSTDHVEETAHRIDQLAAAVGDPGLAAAIAGARAAADDASTPRGDVARAYSDTFDRAQMLADSSFDAMFLTAPEIDQEGLLQGSAELLLAASTARQHIEWEEVAYWETLFPFSEEPETALLDMIRARASYDVAIADVEQQLVPLSNAEATYRTVRASTEMQQFRDVIDSTITRGLATGALEVQVHDAGDLVTVANDLITMAQASFAVTDGHFQIVRSAIADLGAATTAAKVTADAASQRAINVAIAVLLFSALIVTATHWLIVRPLTSMGRAALELRTGRLDVQVAERGPREVTLAAQAMNEAIEHLQLAEHQAAALAQVRLDDPHLSTASPGLIGASLQKAVERLAVTIAEGEELRAQLSHEAHHDGLTGLPNRSAAMELLERLAADTRSSDGGRDATIDAGPTDAGPTDAGPTAVLFVDLDGFKSVNDAHGHLLGDEVLRTVATRLVAASRRTDFVARLGGDEFIVVTDAVASTEEAVHFGERLIHELARPLEVGPLSVSLGASVGLVLTGTTDGETSAEDLLHDVDLAVYRAKADGRGRVTVVDDELRAAAAHRVLVSRDLERALQRNELELHYQPVIDAADGRLTSFEALLRWRCPDGTMIAPDEFIPVAEQSDLILTVDTYVLHLAARQLAEWTDHPVYRDVVVAVNLSGRHLDRSVVVDNVLGALASHDVEPTRLSIEVTETALVSNPVVAARHLAELRAAGVRISIDDFGTGYTSVAHLRSMPVDVLKIDRSFTASLGEFADTVDERLVQLMIDIGNHFDLSVVAEGIETEEQRAAMIALGVHALQGYFFARPVPAAEIDDAVAAARSAVRRSTDALV